MHDVKIGVIRCGDKLVGDMLQGLGSCLDTIAGLGFWGRR
jgi:hypothetical protein